MSRWLKYFFGSFFSHKLARQGENRNFLNSILGLLLAVIVMVAGFICGHNFAFSTFYNSADEFSEFVVETFEDVSLSISEDIAYCDNIINTFGLAESDYKLVIDTRDTSNIYDDFTAVCVSTDGTEISYEDYRLLSSSIQENYTFEVVYSGDVLDIESEENQNKYISYLELSSDTTSTVYNADVAESYAEIQTNKSSLTEYEYAAQIYCLYVTTYYPDISDYESYAEAPTIRGYYASLLTADTSGKYLVILDDQCMGAFYSDDIAVTFTGFYTKLNGFSTSTQSGTLADTFIKGVYKSSSYMYIIVYISNAMSALLYVFILWIILAIVLMAICRFRRIPYGHRFFSSLQIVGSFVFVSGVISALAGFIASFIASQSTAYVCGMIVFYAAIAVRTIVFIIVELIKSNKQKIQSKGLIQEEN